MQSDELIFVVLETVALTGLWLLSAQRLYQVLRQGAHHNAATRARMWLVWSVLLTLALFITLHMLTLTLLPLEGVQLAYLIIIILMFYPLTLLGFAFIDGQALLLHLPMLVLTVAASMLVVGVFHVPSLPVNLSPIDVAHGVFFIYLLILSVGINLPRFSAAHRKEAHAPLRLRFVVMMGMLLALIGLCINELFNLRALAFDGTYRPVVVRTLLSVPCFVLVITAFFVPEKHYVQATAWLKQARYHLTCLYLFPFIRALERAACTSTDRELSPVRVWTVALNAPFQLYKSVIEICDTRKLLQHASDDRARQISAALETLLDAPSDIEQIGWALYPLGKTYLQSGWLNPPR